MFGQLRLQLVTADTRYGQPDMIDMRRFTTTSRLQAEILRSTADLKSDFLAHPGENRRTEQPLIELNGTLHVRDSQAKVMNTFDGYWGSSVLLSNGTHGKWHHGQRH